MDFERMLHPVTLLTGAAGFVLALWAGVGVVVQALLVLMALDLAGGLLVAWRQKTLRSDWGCEGLRRKAHTLLLVFGIWWAQRAVETPLPAADSVAGAFALMELLSLAEKGPMLGGRYPRPVMQALAKVREWLEGEAARTAEQEKAGG